MPSRPVRSQRPPARIQEMVTWNPSSSAYSAYESSDLGNIRFCADLWMRHSALCLARIMLPGPSCSSSSTKATAWVQLTSPIAYGSSATIYMVFQPTTSDFDTIAHYWGEAPNLSTPYANFDNGGYVFTNYWNFAGTSCPTGWTCSGSGLTINNGVSASGGTNYAYTTATYGLTANVLDYLRKPFHPPQTLTTRVSATTTTPPTGQP